MLEKLFFKSSQQELRSGWQVLGFFVVAIAAITFTSFLVTLLKLTPLLNKAETFLIPIFLNATANLAGALFASGLCAWRLASRPFASIGYALHHHWARDFIVGTLAAFLMVTLIVLMQIAIDGTMFEWHLKTDLATISRGLLFPLLLILVAASFEEVMFRGFPLQALADSMPALAAALITSVPFGLIHLGNPSASFFSTINTILAGLWLAAAYFKTRSLWLATGLHMGWNYALGAIYGLPVSGIRFLSSNSILYGTEQSHNWFTGGSYGPEGGASATIALALGTLWLARTRSLSISPQMEKYFSDKKQSEPLPEWAQEPPKITE